MTRLNWIIIVVELERNASNSNLICAKLLCSTFTSGLAENVDSIQRLTQECISRNEKHVQGRIYQ